MNKEAQAFSERLKKAAYKARLQHLKDAQQAFSEKDTPLAIKHYLHYLKVLQSYYGVEGEEDFSPKLFQEKNDQAEIFAISQVYWDLSRAYSQNPKTFHQTQKALGQLVRFSMGFPHRRLSADLLKKYLKKGIPHQRELFKDAYERLRLTPKGCYLATSCYGEGHPHLNKLRKIRDDLERHHFFCQLFALYYRLSPRLVTFFEGHPLGEKLFQTLLLRPLTHLLLKIVNSRKKP